MSNYRDLKAPSDVDYVDDRTGDRPEEEVEFVDLEVICDPDERKPIESLPVADQRNLMLSMIEDLEFEAAQLRRRLEVLDRMGRPNWYH